MFDFNVTNCPKGTKLKYIGHKLPHVDSTWFGRLKHYSGNGLACLETDNFYNGSYFPPDTLEIVSDGSELGALHIDQQP